MSVTLQARRPTPTVVVQALPREEPSDHSPEAVAEERRWLLLLVIPFVLGAAFFAAAIGTGALWLMGPALVIGPGLLIASFVYLGLSSDANSET